MATWIRAAVFALPALLLALLAASFLSVRLLPPQKTNEMVIGGIGEAKVLNPILYTTGADADVLDFLFNGLLRYDEDLQVVGDLAEKWEQQQISTIFFTNATQAAAAAAQLEGMAAKWEAWGLTKPEIKGHALVLTLAEPGRAASEAIYESLDHEFVEGISIVRVELESSARESAEHFMQQASSAPQIVRLWIDTSRAYEFTVSGEAQRVVSELEKHYAANPALKAEVKVTSTLPLLDEPEIIFNLRSGVRWHDGKPFTAEDVEFTYRMIMNESIASPRRPDYELIQSVQVLTPHQLRVVYRKPYSPALLSWMMGMLPKHILAGQSSQWWAENFNRHPIGTGPFKFAEWQTNEFIRLRRNDDYFLGPPHLESVALRVIPDPVAIRLAFETRQIDFWRIDEHAVGAFEHDPRFDLYPSPAPQYAYVGWNLRRPMFQDVKVRQALAHAVNVEAMIKYLLYGYGTQSTGIFPPQMWFFNDQVQPFGYDPERARELLADAGWTPGPDGVLQKDGKRFAFTLITNQGNEIRKDIATLVQADLRKIGIAVDVQIYEWAVFISQYINKHDFDACVLGWSLGYDYDQYQIWHSSQTDPEELNHVGYKNSRVDELLEEIRTEYDRDKIKAFAAELQQTIYHDQPYLFLHVPQVTAAMWKDSYRVRRPAGEKWEEESVRSTKAGWSFYRSWFYKPEYAPVVTQ